MSERSIFLAVLEIADPGEREAFLDQACAGEPALREQVEQLLKAHQEPGPFMERPAPDLVGTREEPPIQEGPGTVIGPYKLLEQIGEGGFGVVFLAEQLQPVRRKVALKILKPGMDTRQVVARFEAERQALALMDHPNIAQVYDGGTTATGRPFFIMELVKGVPITAFCDQNQLPPRQRLELFGSVCQAVQHAHQKGIIHRDLKPSNVLVTMHDTMPVVKVIDFGVAKALGQELTDKSLFTGFTQMIGTPLYMSPEQAGQSGLDIDTRSDIYSLGVLLYELLTGTTPFDQERLKTLGYDEIRRIIREEEPAKPSTRISTLGLAATTVSANRRSDPRRLSRLCRGELDWMVMKALEKDRNRRYESASAFAADVQRYLHDEPVQACPPSAWYRLRKFGRRNQGPVAAGVALAALLALGSVGTSIGLVWALREERAASAAATAEAQQRQDAETQRDHAVTAEKQAIVEKQRANEEAAIAKAVNDFLQNDLLAEAAPGKNARNKKVTVEELLGRAAAHIAGKFDQQPRIEAAIRQTIGDTYYKLGNYAAAQPHLERALEVRRRILGEQHPDTLQSMNSLAELYQDQGQFLKAEPLYVKTLEISRRALGEEHPNTLVVMNNLAELYYAQGLYPKAEPLYVKALEVSRRVLGEAHPDTLTSMNNLGDLYRIQGQFAKAAPLLVKALEIRRRVLGEEHLDTLCSMHNLAVLSLAQGDYAKAAPLLIKALEVRRRVLGEEHPDTLAVMSNLARLYRAQDQFAKAEPLFVEALEVSRRVLGEEHPDTLSLMNNLAGLYRAQDQFAKAAPLFVKALEVRRRVLGEEHPNTLTSMNNLALLYYAQGQFAKAEVLYVKTLEVRRRVLGEEHPNTLTSMNNLAGLYYAQGQFVRAESLFVKALEVRRRVLGEEHPDTLGSMNNLAGLYQAQHQFARAELLYREALEKSRQRHGEAWAPAAGALNALGLNLLKQQKYTDAEPLLRECLKIREQKLPDDWITFNTRSMLGESLVGQKKYADAEPLLVQGYEGLKQREAKIPPTSKIRLTEALERLVQLYEASGKPDEAAKWRKKRDAHGEAGRQTEKPKEK